MSKKRVAVTLRKPQASADIESFVASEELPGTAPTPPPVVADGAVSHRARDYREVTLYLSSELVREMSLYCMDRNADMNRLVSEAVRKHLAPASAAETPARSSGWQAALELVLHAYRDKLSALLARQRWGVRP